MKKAAIIFAIVFVINIFVPMAICFLPKNTSKTESTNNELVTLFNQKKSDMNLTSNGIIIDFFD